MVINTSERILILAKTYPCPSSKYSETSCVAGINEAGEMRRLFPVPFRMLENNKQFKKWQWIDVLLEKSKNDNRPESHKIFIDTIQCLNFLSLDKHFNQRLSWLDRIPTFTDMNQLISAQKETKVSIARVIPEKVIDLEIEASASKEWNQEEIDKLLQQQMQHSLFDLHDLHQQIKTLRKVPYDFYYRFRTYDNQDTSYKLKIIDWEACALYWNCFRQHGSYWEIPFREKLLQDLPKRNLTFLIGNMHRFQQQWLIISLLYFTQRNEMSVSQLKMF